MEEILGIIPSIKIPKPIGGRVNIRPIKSTLTIEERYRKAGLIGVAAEKERPRNSSGIIVSISIDPLIQENFKVGMMVWFPPLLGTDILFLGHSFRTLDFGDILNTEEEVNIP